MRLIDTHQHLIHHHRFGYEWTQSNSQLATEDFSADAYNIASAGASISKTVFVETAVDDRDYRDEVRFVSTLVREADNALAAVIASCRPETQSGFNEWLDECEKLEVCGFRRVLHVMPDELSTTSTFRGNLREIGARGFPFDLCILQRQLAIGEALVSACDNVEFVLDHCGVPDIAGGDFETWKAGIAAIASHPNVSCKLSGLPSYCGEEQNKVDAIRPYFEFVLDEFGKDRILWGGDWPVINLGGGLASWIKITEALLSPLSDDEIYAITTDNAIRIYGLSHAEKMPG